MRCPAPAALLAVAVAAIGCGGNPAAPTESEPVSIDGRLHPPGLDPPGLAPAGLVPLNDQPWAGLTTLGWNYLRRTSSKDADIVADTTAPFSPPQVLRMVFTPSMLRDSEPSVHWISLAWPREIHAQWWMKLSTNWTASPAGAGKIAFLWPRDGIGVIYSNIAESGPPHHINIVTTWEPYGYRFWEPNLATTSIRYDRWYRIEWYAKWPSAPGAGDGILRWGVDGVLNGDYTGVSFPTGEAGFQQFEFAPTLQKPPPHEQYMYIDHVAIRTRASSAANAAAAPRMPNRNSQQSQTRP